MSNKNSSEELQSRREFFKKAAKAALPVVGAVVLSSLPILKSEAAPTGCMSLCSDGCTDRCSGCTGSCSGSCNTSCYGSCQMSCNAMSYYY
mgnify:CR=1 FL=1